MEKPVYPREWLDLRLEFKDEYLLNQNNKELNDKGTQMIKLVKNNNRFLFLRRTPL